MNVFLVPADNHPSKTTDAEAKPNSSPLASLLRLNGRTSLYWTAKALIESNSIRSICVVCDKEFQAELSAELPQDPRIQFEEIGDSEPGQQFPLSESIQFIEKIARERIKAPAMIISCTAPHWTSRIYNDVISHVRNSDIDSALFYVQTPDAEKKTPIFKKPIYVLQCAVVGPQAIDGLAAQVARFSPEIQKLDAQSSAARSSKKANKANAEQRTPTGVLISMSFKLASIAGMVFIWRLVKRNLTPNQVEKKAAQLLKTNFKFVELRDETLHLRLSEPSHQAKIEDLIYRKWGKS